jgi:hypothetical protein
LKNNSGVYVFFLRKAGMRVDALALAASATGICTRARAVMAIANATAGKESKRGMEEVVTRSMIGDGEYLILSLY